MPLNHHFAAGLSQGLSHFPKMTADHPEMDERHLVSNVWDGAAGPLTRTDAELPAAIILPRPKAVWQRPCVARP